MRVIKFLALISLIGLFGACSAMPPSTQCQEVDGARFEWEKYGSYQACLSAKASANESRAAYGWRKALSGMGNALQRNAQEPVNSYHCTPDNVGNYNCQ